MEVEKTRKRVLNEIPEIDFVEIFSLLWDSRKKIIKRTLYVFLFSALFSLTIPNQYKSSAVLTVSQNLQTDQTSIGSSIGGLSLLASGFNNPKLHRISETLESWDFIDSFIEEYNQEVYVYAAEGWNKKLNKIEINNWLYDEERKSWLIRDRESETGFRGPTSWQLFKRFSNYLDVYIDSSTGLITVSIEYYSPYKAKDWVQDLVNHLNSHIRDRELEVTNRNIAYLQDQIEKTSLSYIKEIFFKSIEEELKKKMFAEANSEYAVSYVTKPMIAEKKSGPSRTLLCLFLAILGFFIFSLRVLYLFYFPRSKEQIQNSFIRKILRRLENIGFIKNLNIKLKDILRKIRSN